MKKPVMMTPRLIAARMFDDFGVRITPAQATEILNGIRKGTVLWANGRFHNTALDATINQVTPNRVIADGASVYSVREWNAVNR